MDQQNFGQTENVILRGHPEIEKHLDSIIKAVAKDYNDRLNYLQGQVKERDFFLQKLNGELKDLKGLHQEKDIESRHYSKESSHLALRVEQLEKIRQNLEDKLREVTARNNYFENELKNKEELNIRLSSELMKETEENRYFRERNVVQDRKILDLEQQAASAISRTLKAESFLLTKDEIVKSLNKKVVEEKERNKKLEDTVIEIEEYTYRLKGDIDRVAKERDFLKEEIDKFRKIYGF